MKGTIQNNIILSRKITNYNIKENEYPAPENGNRNDWKDLLSRENSQKPSFKKNRKKALSSLAQYNITNQVHQLN